MSKVPFHLVAALLSAFIGCKGGDTPKPVIEDVFPAWNATGINVAAFLVADDFYNLVDGNDSLIKTTDLPLLAHVGIVTTAKQYETDFDENEIAADRKYSSRKILLSGTVASINKDVAGGGYFSLIGYGLEGVQAHLDDQSMDRAADVKKGHTVVLVCDPGMRITGFATASHCVFLSQFMKAGNFTPEDQVRAFFAGTSALPVNAFLGVLTGYAIGIAPTTLAACTQKPSKDTCNFKSLGREAVLQSLLEPLKSPEFLGRFRFESCQTPATEKPPTKIDEPDTCVRVRPIAGQ